MDSTGAKWGGGGGGGVGGEDSAGWILNAIANCHESSEQLTEENHAIEHYYVIIA